jgi:hypothetical protein
MGTAIDPFAWKTLAACKGKKTALFFEEHARQGYTTICPECPVKDMCLETALLYNLEGVWGGMSDRQRNRKFSKEYRESLRDDAIESGTFVPGLKL